MRFLLFDGGTIQRQAVKQASSTRRAINFRPVMEEIALDMMRITDQNFQTQGRRGGGSWKKLKPDTVRRKGNSRILFSSGMNPGYDASGVDELYKSVSKPGGPGQEIKIFKSSVHFGTKVKHAKHHQYGTAFIPKREFIKFLPRDQERWRGMILRHVLIPFAGR